MTPMHSIYANATVEDLSFPPEILVPEIDSSYLDSLTIDFGSQKDVNDFLRPTINTSDVGRLYHIVNNTHFPNIQWKNVTLNDLGLNIHIPDHWNASVKGNDIAIFSGKLDINTYDTSLNSGSIFDELEPLMPDFLDEGKSDEKGRFIITISNKGAPFINNTKVLANTLLKNCMGKGGCESIEPTITSKYIIDGEDASSFKIFDIHDIEVIETIHDGVHYEIKTKYNDSVPPSLDFTKDPSADNMERQEHRKQYELMKNYLLSSIRWLP
jgi:hypothetical protein